MASRLVRILFLGGLLWLWAAISPGAEAETRVEAPRSYSCRGSVAQWTATLASTGVDQKLMLGARAEGGCPVTIPIKFPLIGRPYLNLWCRVDGDASPGSSEQPSLSNWSTVSTLESWCGVSGRLVGPLSFAAFGGWQKSLAQGGEVGAVAGDGDSSKCLGARVDFKHGGYAIGGVCDQYAPIQIPGLKAKKGATWVSTLVVPLAGDRLKFAVNLALSKPLEPEDQGKDIGKGDQVKPLPRGLNYVLIFGPTISLGSGGGKGD